MQNYLNWLLFIPLGILIWSFVLAIGLYIIGQIFIELKYSDFLKKLLKNSHR